MMNTTAAITRLPALARRNRRWMFQDLAVSLALVTGFATAAAVTISALSQVL